MINGVFAGALSLLFLLGLIPALVIGGTKISASLKTADGSNDLIGYTGGEEGVPVEMKAGGMAVFSSTTFHRSGRNASGDVRRACEYDGGLT